MVRPEKIVCPECGLTADAVVEIAQPWDIYVHACQCGYVIGESEWNVADVERFRLELEDEGQDLSYVVLEAQKGSDKARVVEIPAAVTGAWRELYLGKSVELSKATKGERFTFADPKPGSTPKASRWIVKALSKEGPIQ